MSMLTQAWLEDQTSIRCLLVEVTARNVTTSTEVTFYLSNMGYTTTSADVTFLPYLTGTLSTTESLGIDNNLSMSFGDIQVANLNGELDSWLDSTKYIWVNRTVKVYLGDPRWRSLDLAAVRTNFEKVFDGVVADVDSSARDSLNIKVRDKLQRLNYPLTENVLGTYGTWAGGQTNQDTIRPIVFGEVSNMSPVLVGGTATPEYMFNDTNIGTLVTATTATGNLITCNSVTGFATGTKIVFTMPALPYAVSVSVTGIITGATLSLGTQSGTVIIGMLVIGTDVAPNTYITGGSGNSWTVSVSQTLSNRAFTLTASSFGNLASGYPYFVKDVYSATNTFTVSSALNGAAVPLTTATLTSTGSTINSVQAEVNVHTTELLIEIRDNGLPIYTADYPVYIGTGTRPQGATVDLTAGKFTLSTGTGGPVTCSVQGIKRSINFTSGQVENTYVNNIANLIALIVTQYGQPNQRLSILDDLDLVNFSAFAAAQTAAVGTVVSDRTNILNVCQDLAGSAAAQLFFNRAGRLQLLILGTPISTTIVPSMSITDNDILHHSLHISQRTTVVAATKIGYCQNYTPQSVVNSQVPGGASSLFADPWYSNTVIDTVVQTNYKLTSVPIQKDTKLIAGADASALATSLNNYFKVPRTVYAFTGTAKLMYLKLGQSVTLTHNRFGLNSGKSGQVITLAPDWVNGTINVEVII